MHSASVSYAVAPDPPALACAAVTGYTAGWLATPLPAACEGLSARSCLACQGLATPAAIQVRPAATSWDFAVAAQCSPHSPYGRRGVEVALLASWQPWGLRPFSARTQ